MRKQPATFTNEEIAEIQQELKGTHPSHVYKRLMVLKVKAVDGLASDEAAKLFALHTTSVNRIIKRYKTQGMTAIVGKRHNHGNRYMTREEESAFLSRFKTQAENGHVIEVSYIHKAYEETVGHRVTRNAIYYLLHRHNWRKVMPRSKHPKKASDEEIEAYKKNHRNDPKPEEDPAKATRDVSGRGWIWPDK